MDIVQENRELISPKTSDRVSGTQALLQPSRYGDEKFFPNQVSEAVVDDLEAIDVPGDYFYAVLFLDVDRFKIVNDSLGHLIGDELLIAVSRRLKECLRPGDTVARFGGDEFAILLDDVHDVNDATRLAERIQKNLTVPFTLHEHEVFATASIGIAMGAAGYEQPQDILRDADLAMYHAKSRGRAGWKRVDRGMRADAVALLRLETDLWRARVRPGVPGLFPAPPP